MARPYRFEDERSQSPFNPPPNTQSSLPPSSYKANVNRNPTRKWTEAKSYNYDGDDWGGYDPYDEYGSYDEPAPAPQQNIRPRQSSFDRGDERRAFSAGTRPPPSQYQDNIPPPLQQPPSSSARQYAQEPRPSSGGGPPRRDFSQPAQVPSPLHTRGSPAPAPRPFPAASFPPRKSSMSRSEQPSIEPRSEPVSGTDKPLPASIPFIRPSDIYKRMEEEKEIQRQSQDSSRPSMDSLQGKAVPHSSLPHDLTRERTNSGTAQRGPGSRRSLDAVSESNEHDRTAPGSLGPMPESTNEQVLGREALTEPTRDDSAQVSRVQAVPNDRTHPHLEDAVHHSQEIGSPPRKINDIPTKLPPVGRVSGFGTDFWSSSFPPSEVLDSESQHIGGRQGMADAAKSLELPSQYLQETPGLEEMAPSANSWRAGMLNPAEKSEPDPYAQRNQIPRVESQPTGELQSVVHQAFDRHDDNSVPPTPVSQTNSQTLGSDMSRSNTDSTRGISPIMSRVPSAATAEARVRAAETREPGVPPIAEEPSIPTTPEIAPSANRPSVVTPIHSRNTSGETQVPRYSHGLNQPSPQGSPARTPELYSTRRLSHPMRAEFSEPEPPDLEEPLRVEPAMTGLGVSNGTAKPALGQEALTSYATREVDLAEHVASSPEVSPTRIGDAANNPKTGFLNTHNLPDPTTSAPDMTRPRSPYLTSPVSSPVAGRQSPVPGRVRDLAGKFNEIEDLSRRSSQTSLTSRGSMSSWSRGDDVPSLRRTTTLDSPVESPVKEDAFDTSGISPTMERGTRPTIAPQPSFRPHLPGEWISTTNLPTVAQGTESRADQRPSGLSTVDTAQNERSPSPSTPTATKRMADVDLTPTTAKYPLREKSVKNEGNSTIEAVKAAGAALGASLMATAGASHQSRDFASSSKPGKEEHDLNNQSRRSTGPVFLRPLAPDRADTSTTVSTAPSPPPKDSPEVVQPDNSSGYFPRTASPPKASTLSANGYRRARHSEDYESDRLRREIERSLTPQPPDQDDWERDDETPYSAQETPYSVQETPEHHSIAELPASTHIPHSPEQQEKSLNANSITRPSEHDVPPQTGSSAASTPGILDQRFSWENRQSGGAFFNPAALGPELDRPRTPLHVVNTNLSDQVNEAVVERAPAERMHESPASLNVTSPVAEMRELEPPRPEETRSISPLDPTDVRDPMDEQSNEAPSSPPLMPTSPIMINEKPLPLSPGGEATAKSPTSYSAPLGGAAAPARIPPFREILAIREASDRIDKYNSTRQQFADMDTGLRDWLSTTLTAYPEHNHLLTDGGKRLPAATMGSIRHKNSPSIIKIAKNLGGSYGGNQGPSSAAPSDNAASSPQNSVNLQAKGKDLFLSANKFGSKGMVGAKGWLTKGRQKLRESGGSSDKGLPPDAPQNPALLDTAAPPPESIRTPLSMQTEATPAAVPSPRPRARSRSLSRASNRLSATFERIRSSRGRSRSRSRPQSLVLSDNQSIPGLDHDGGLENVDAHPMPDLRGPDDVLSPSASDWTASWNQEGPGSSIKSPMSPGTERLGVLPSPGAETFATSDRESRELAPDVPSLPGKHSRPVSGVSQRNPGDALQPAPPLPHHEIGIASSRDVEGPLPDDDELYQVTPSQSSQNIHSTALQPDTKEATNRYHELPVNDSLGADGPTAAETASLDLLTEGESVYETSNENEPEDTLEIPIQEDHAPIVLSQQVEAPTPTEQASSRSTAIPSNAQQRSATPPLELGGLHPHARNGEQNVPSRSPVSSLSGYTPDPKQDNRESEESIRPAIRTREHDSPPSDRGDKPSRPKIIGRGSLPSQKHIHQLANGSQTPERVKPQKAMHRLLDRSYGTDSPTVPESARPPYKLVNYSDDGASTQVASPLEEKKQLSPSDASIDRAPAESRAPPIGQSFEPHAQTSAVTAYRDRPYTNNNSFSAPRRQETTPPRQGQSYQVRDMMEVPRAHATPPPQYTGATSNDRAESHQGQQLSRQPQGQERRVSPLAQEQEQPMSRRTPSDVYRASGMDPPMIHPRKQTTEYQLPGVGPPDMSPQEAEAGFFRSMTQRNPSPPKATSRPHPHAMSNEQRTFSDDQIMGVPTPTEPQVNRPHPHTVPNEQRTFSDDQIMQTPAAVEPQRRRRSSLFGSLSRNSSSADTRVKKDKVPDLPVTGPALIAAQRARENANKNTMVKKTQEPTLQRSSTSAISPDPEKKRRFSGFGSIFGRSKSTTQEPADKRRGTRLSKPAPPGEGSALKQSTLRSARTQEYASVPAPSDQSYLMNDTLHQASPNASQRHSSGHFQQSTERLPQGAAVGYGTPAPGQPYEQRQPTLPQIPPTRRLHSGNMPSHNRFSFHGVPEEYHPVSSSYRGGVAPPMPERLSQHYEQTIPPQGAVSQRAISDPARNPAQPQHVSSGSASGTGQSMPQEHVRRTSGPASPGRRDIDGRQRVASVGQYISEPPVQASDPEFYGARNMPPPQPVYQSVPDPEQILRQRGVAAPYQNQIHIGTENRPARHYREDNNISDRHQPRDPPQQTSTPGFYSGSDATSPRRDRGQDAQKPSFAVQSREHPSFAQTNVEPNERMRRRSPTREETNVHNDRVRAEYAQQQQHVQQAQQGQQVRQEQQPQQGPQVRQRYYGQPREQGQQLDRTDARNGQGQYPVGQQKEGYQPPQNVLPHYPFGPQSSIQDRPQQPRASQPQLPPQQRQPAQTRGRNAPQHTAHGSQIEALYHAGPGPQFRAAEHAYTSDDTQPPHATRVSDQPAPQQQQQHNPSTQDFDHEAFSDPPEQATPPSARHPQSQYQQRYPPQSPYQSQPQSQLQYPPQSPYRSRDDNDTDNDNESGNEHAAGHHYPSRDTYASRENYASEQDHTRASNERYDPTYGYSHAQGQRQGRQTPPPPSRISQTSGRTPRGAVGAVGHGARDGYGYGHGVGYGVSDDRGRDRGRGDGSGSRGGNGDGREGMQSTAYPGQQWAPAGVEGGHYRWE